MRRHRAHPTRYAHQLTQDARILLSVSNLSHLRSPIIGAWIAQFEQAYGVSLHSEQQRLLALCSQLDRQLLHAFVQEKGTAISAVIEHGILHSGMDWGNMTRPTTVNAFLFRALLLVVEVHAEVRAVVAPLVSRVISAVVEVLSAAILSAYSRVPSFNQGGMLQATLEIEFVHQTMAHHVSPTAEKYLKEVYETISQRYTDTLGAGADPALLQRELEGVKQTLVANRKATALAFLCFRRPKGEAKHRA